MVYEPQRRECKWKYYEQAGRCDFDACVAVIICLIQFSKQAIVSSQCMSLDRQTLEKGVE